MISKIKTNSYGYIYIRQHESYNIENVCKLGVTTNIPERDNQYVTGEIRRGYFNNVYEISIKQLNIIDNLLKYEFQYLNVKYNGGTEFYNKQIIDLIEPFFNTIGIKYRKLSSNEITKLTKNNRIKHIIKKIDIKSLIQLLKSNSKMYSPRDNQLNIINNSYNYFQSNNKGLLVIPCGVGKTLISLWITQKLDSNTIVIGVPNKLLLKQWEKYVKIIFRFMPYLIISSGITIENIINFLDINKSRCIIITTYSSSYKVYNAIHNTSFVFDMKINDEVHHLTSHNMELSNTTKKYINMLNIASNKQLSLTATIKHIENIDDNDTVISNDNIEYFGEIIEKKSLLWAINEKIVCDYIIQTIITNDEQIERQTIKFNITEENDKRLFLSAFASLKSICCNHSHHLLIYANNKDNTLKIIQYIQLLLDNKYFVVDNFHYSNYHSDMKSRDQKEILNSFEKSKYGIIACVYCLGEGWDFPLLDGVVFAENMSSNIRIVQSALRASRKNSNEENKITKIILPILNNDWIDNSENPDFKKVKDVIYQMSLEDETIIQKIKVIKIDIKKHKTVIKDDKIEIDHFGEYDNELTDKLKLKTIKRVQLDITYNKAKQIIATKNIQCKEDYYKLCNQDIRLPEDPEFIFKKQFVNWIDYLSIDRKYYDFDTCRNKINQYMIEYPDIKDTIDLSATCIKLCELDKRFPPSDLWLEYYNVKKIQEIIIFNKINKKQLLEILS